jgi:hypothetical protein
MNWGNVLFFKVKPGGFWKYTINGQDYYVPNCGYLFIVYDFGFAYIPNKMETTLWYEDKKYYNTVKENPRLIADYRWFTESFHMEHVKLPEKITDFISSIHWKAKSQTAMVDIFPMFFSHWSTTVPTKDTDILDRFSIGAPICIPDYLVPFLRDPSLQDCSSYTLARKTAHKK